MYHASPDTSPHPVLRRPVGPCLGSPRGRWLFPFFREFAMAGDWIKMRIALPSDPKVLEMAGILAEDRSFISWLTDPVQVHCKESAFEHVTSDVLSSLVVTGLLRVWGMVRDRGKQKGDDAALLCCSVWQLSEIARVPGFGTAMEVVGWAIDDEEGHMVIFPNFFKENGLSAESIKDGPMTPAERQKRYREKKNRQTGWSDESDEKRNAAVTQKSPREEKRREESFEEEEAVELKLIETERIKINWARAEAFTGITDEDRTQWKVAYPACNIAQQLASMHQWLLANPAKATRSNWRRFITNWLSRSQDKGGDVRSNGMHAPRPIPPVGTIENY